MHTEAQTHRGTDTQRHRHTDTRTHKHADARTHKHINTQATEPHSHTDTHRLTDTGPDTHSHTTQTSVSCWLPSSAFFFLLSFCLTLPVSFYPFSLFFILSFLSLRLHVFLRLVFSRGGGGSLWLFFLSWDLTIWRRPLF